MCDGDEGGRGVVENARDYEQYDQIWFLVTNILFKVAQMFGDFLGYLKGVTF